MQTHYIFNVSASGGKLLIDSPQINDFRIGIERGTATDGDLLALLQETFTLYLMCNGVDIAPQISINLMPFPSLVNGTQIHMSYTHGHAQPLPN